MSRRALQFASLFLLLAAMGPAADAATHRAPAFAAPYVRILMAQRVAAHAASGSALTLDTAQKPALSITSAEHAYASAAWEPTGPVTSAVAMQAATGRGL